LTALALFSKVRGPMARDPASVDADLVALVRERSRPADEPEVRAALAPLTPAEEKALRRALLDPPRGRLGPFSWADIARGMEPQVAVARELSGYYALQAERDVLAAMVRVPPTAQHAEPRRAAIAEPAPTRPRRGGAVREKKPPSANASRAETVLGLFAYHRDAPLVARALGLSLEELTAELDDLGIRRKAFRLVRQPDAQMPIAASLPGHSGPPLRRRPRATPREVEPTPLVRDSAQDDLKALLAEVGPRRDALRERLGLSEIALLARLRDNGLEREFALRERDLIRGLWSKHRASESRVAAEIGIPAARLREIIRDRGLGRELDAARQRLRRAARSTRWPGERIATVLHREADLRDLELYDEMRAEVAARVAVIWKTLQGKPEALELLRKKLHLTEGDAQKLRTLLQLR
jgi:hypothetical protein